LIDVDRENGNANKTQMLIKSYMDVRKTLAASSGDDEGRVTSHMFRTEIKGAYQVRNEDRLLLTPYQQDRLKLRDALPRNGFADATTRSMLTDADIDQPVEAGLYGNPTLGRVILKHLEFSNQQSEDLDGLITQIRNETQNGNEVYIYLAGSLFGGTGTTCIPHFCKNLLNKYMTEENGEIVTHRDRANLKMAACLMNPYFKPNLTKDENGNWIYFDDTTNTWKQSEINPDDFFKKAQDMLKVYQHMFSPSPFKCTVILGEVKMSVRGKYAPEGGAQHNWPHIYELCGAAESIRFFSGQSPDDGKWYHVVGNEIAELRSSNDGLKEFTWEDYINSASIRKPIENFLIVSNYFSCYVVPALFKLQGVQFVPINDNDKKIMKNIPKWAKENFARKSGGLWPFWVNYKWKIKDATDAGLAEIAGSHFKKLYDYLCDSATWYCRLVHDFNEDEKAANVMLSYLFGSRGANTLKLRSAKPDESTYGTYNSAIYSPGKNDKRIEKNTVASITLRSPGIEAMMYNSTSLPTAFANLLITLSEYVKNINPPDTYSV
jgi:hypothetical protein